MGTEGISPEFWGELAQGEFRSLPRQQWQTLIADDELESLVAAGVMVDLPDTLLDGRPDRYDFGEGRQTYEIEINGKLSRALPEGPGDQIEITRAQASVITAHAEKALSFLAEKNGFTPSTSNRWVASGLAEVGRINLKGCWIIWFACFDPIALQKPAVLSHLRGLINSETIVVVSSPNTTQWPRELAREHRIVQAPFPSTKSDWHLDRRLFCTPELGLKIAAVAEQLWTYDDVALLISESEGAIFLYGNDLELKRDTRPFNYINELAKLAPSSTEFDFFAKHTLKYSNHSSPRQAVYDDQKKIRKVIELKITDPELQAQGTALFDSSSDGKLGLPLERKEICRWETGRF